MGFEDLSPEIMEKVRACTSYDDLKTLADTEGFELSDEDLQAVAGGGGFGDPSECIVLSCNELKCYDLKICDDFSCHNWSPL